MTKTERSLLVGRPRPPERGHRQAPGPSKPNADAHGQKAAKRAVALLAILALSSAGQGLAEQVSPKVTPMTLDPVPPQPAESDWQFVKELQQPYHQKTDWPPRDRRPDEADLSRGVIVEARFPDPLKRLDTAYQDLHDFLDATNIGQAGPFKIVTDQISTQVPETYRIVVTQADCRIQAGDTEGIRRGIFYVQDRILSAQAPFLPLGTVQRVPVIRTRISRCFFGPIKRPPKNRDELLDDVNYYPDQYLNRLAHEGVNGLWLTIRFADLCRTEAVPEYGQDAERRLAKLRDTVRRCLRYGIKIYAFCIEPAGFPANSPVLAAHPDLGGHRTPSLVYFCPSGKAGQAHLEQATRTLFSAVPGLGGLINISIGERPTICPNGGIENNNCPRCSKRQPWEVLADSLSAMARGMHAVNPSAELISWAYIPDNGTGGKGWGDDAHLLTAEHMPDGVILQHNFESGGGKEQLGKWRHAGDYWLSYIGPAPRFRACAERAVARGTRMFAKLQVGCSHEVASVPFVPVPGNLYRKYKAMRELGVSGVMQCWFFGNYPGVMNRAAGELAFAPFPPSEEAFLLDLARRDWGHDADKVVQAWRLFSEGYESYPLNCTFGYYGPMADGPVWPLHLVPVDRPLAPTWLLDQYPPSGDRIGECITSTHTLDEVLTLCQRMAETWNRGVEILQGLKPKYSGNRQRLMDIGLAEALGIQFQSGYDNLKFYALRESLAWRQGPERAALLDEMEALVKTEIAQDERLLALTEADSRLGFHSEAEGYKYHPAKIRWRLTQLKRLLATEFPEVRRRLQARLAAFPEYTGQEPTGKVYDCRVSDRPVPLDDAALEGPWKGLARQTCVDHRATSKADDKEVVWCATRDGEALYVGVECRDARARNSAVELIIEPKRLWPVHRFFVTPDGSHHHRLAGGQEIRDWQAVGRRANSTWSIQVRIPLASLGLSRDDRRPIRMNVATTAPPRRSWVAFHPLASRLLHGSDNPADLGWLRFAPKSKPAK
ncbi:MAG: hypothetical protein JXQ73_03995 [Phycisphaerae bacterium]|nr:hypothetical protein [Phycisphaerae bacterium]